MLLPLLLLLLLKVEKQEQAEKSLHLYSSLAHAQESNWKCGGCCSLWPFCGETVWALVEISSALLLMLVLMLVCGREGQHSLCPLQWRYVEHPLPFPWLSATP